MIGQQKACIAALLERRRREKVRRVAAYRKPVSENGRPNERLDVTETVVDFLAYRACGSESRRYGNRVTPGRGGDPSQHLPRLSPACPSDGQCARQHGLAKWWPPDAVVFVESVPLGAIGKVLKNRLREAFQDYPLSL